MSKPPFAALKARLLRRLGMSRHQIVHVTLEFISVPVLFVACSIHESVSVCMGGRQGNLTRVRFHLQL